MWLLLQPRGHLGGYFLYAALAAGLIGVLFGGKAIEYPAFKGWASSKGEPLMPLLFITVACGACSGFHALVASGTTSKQLRCESDAKPIAYGAMLLEAFVAVISLSCLMMLPASSPTLAKNPSPNLIYGLGMANFLSLIKVPAAFGISFGLLAFTTFVYDTLDVSTRLGRYILQELLGWQGRAGRWVATALTAGVPVFFVTQKSLDAKGDPIPAWKVFWGLFGASNQLLAALTLIGITVWLARTYRAWWVWFITGLPMVFMYTMSGWALVRFIRIGLFDAEGRLIKACPSTTTIIAMVLAALAALLLVEMVIVLVRPKKPAAAA
jgi:carbon starvation protein